MAGPTWQRHAQDEMFTTIVLFDERYVMHLAELSSQSTYDEAETGRCCCCLLRAKPSQGLHSALSMTNDQQSIEAYNAMNLRSA